MGEPKYIDLKVQQIKNYCFNEKTSDCISEVKYYYHNRIASFWLYNGFNSFMRALFISKLKDLSLFTQPCVPSILIANHLPWRGSELTCDKEAEKTEAFKTFFLNKFQVMDNNQSYELYGQEKN